MFLSEPTLILSDEIRDPRVHRTIVQVIGLGAHALNEISAASFVSKTHLPAPAGSVATLAIPCLARAK